MKRIIFGLVAATLAAVPALAETYNIGSLTTNRYVKAVDWDGVDPLEDTFNFSLTGNTYLHTTLEDEFGLNNFVGKLYQVGNEAAIATFGPYNDGDLSDSGQIGTYGAGNYQLVVSGIPDQGGSYSLRMSSDVAAPVPGPAGVVVAAAGAAVIAFRRRRAAQLKTA
ncbi:hypothetical protein [Sphingomonas bacterium]|uniref:hypothetical protein n=1 Tax=Sphingomonas bacterium TaxID=1895847 RepID=UPI00157644F0|nr:hypothetical protein [Sphingomonas bacterium]